MQKLCHLEKCVCVYVCVLGENISCQVGIFRDNHLCLQGLLILPPSYFIVLNKALQRKTIKNQPKSWNHSFRWARVSFALDNSKFSHTGDISPCLFLNIWCMRKHDLQLIMLGNVSTLACDGESSKMNMCKFPHKDLCFLCMGRHCFEKFSQYSFSSCGISLFFILLSPGYAYWLALTTRKSVALSYRGNKIPIKAEDDFSCCWVFVNTIFCL
jgi:hypothetical protein